MDSINDRSIQMLLRGENDLKQSDEFQANLTSGFLHTCFDSTSKFFRPGQWFQEMR